MNVINIIKYGKITNQKFYDKFLLLLDKLSLTDDKRKENYSLKSLDLDNHLTFDLLINNNDIVCFSGLYNRPAWGEGIFRSSNRTFVNPNYRTNLYNFLNPQYIVPTQVKAHQNEIKLVFNSREHYKSEFYFKKAKEKVDFYNDWLIHPGMVQVVPGSNKKTGYQKIMYKLFDEEIPFKTITVDEWKNL
jgi:hypothetical protein